MSHDNLEVSADFPVLNENDALKLKRDQEVKTEYHTMVRSESSDSWSHKNPSLEESKTLVLEGSSTSNLEQVRDQDLIRSWLELKKSPHTIRAFKRVSNDLITHLHPKTLKEADLSTLQLFVSFAKSLKPETRKQRVVVMRSLFSFAHRTGYLPSNPASFLPSVSGENRLSERYLSEEEVMRMITLASSQRDRAILKLLYSGGLRASEFCGLRWKNISPREDGAAQIQIDGKGGKIRNVVISPGTYQGILALKLPGALDAQFVFMSQKGRGLSYRRLHELVDIARLRAGITKKVSPHWLRHAHASHALDRGAPIHLVQATLGHASVATTGRYLHARPQESSGRYLSL